MAGLSLEIENQSYKIAIETSTESSTNSVEVSYDTTNTVQISSLDTLKSPSNASDIVGLADFVSNYIDSIGIGVYKNYANISDNYNISADDNIIFANSSSDSILLQLPTASGVGGKEYIIKKVSGSNDVNISPSIEGETIDGNSNFAIHFQNESITIVSNNSNWFIV